MCGIADILNLDSSPMAHAVSLGRYLSQCDANNPLHRMLYFDTNAWLVDYMPLRGGTLMMTASPEARVPHLDRKLIEVAAHPPGNIKLRGRTVRFLLKKLAIKVSPNSIVDRPSQSCQDQSCVSLGAVT